MNKKEMKDKWREIISVCNDNQDAIHSFELFEGYIEEIFENYKKDVFELAGYISRDDILEIIDEMKKSKFYHLGTLGDLEGKIKKLGKEK